MGDRFYFQQANYKPKRRLKREIVAWIEELLGERLPSLEKMTVADLLKLEEKIESYE